MRALRSKPWKSIATSGWRRERFFDPGEEAARRAEAAEFAARENVDVIDVAIAAEKGAHSGLMTQVISACGLASRIAATAGSVWTMSPSELGLMMRIDL